MKTKTSSKVKSAKVTASIGVGLLLTLLAVQANAACATPQQQTAPSLRQQQLGAGQARLIPAAFLQISDHDSDDAAIVGLWKFQLVAKGSTGPGAPPDGVTVDFGFATWHSDGTELMNSGARPPITGDFCMGAWEQTGPSTFKLNHFALAWDDTGSVFVGPANIREFVKVDRTGNSYKGTFTIDQYSTDGTTHLGPHVAGVVSATRITAD
jgi:hypothetical protein